TAEKNRLPGVQAVFKKVVEKTGRFCPLRPRVLLSRAADFLPPSLLGGRGVGGEGEIKPPHPNPSPPGARREECLSPAPNSTETTAAPGKTWRPPRRPECRAPVRGLSTQSLPA